MILAPTLFIPVPSSTLIHPRDTVTGKVSAGATVTITMPTNGSSDVVFGMLGNAISGTSAPTTPTGFTSIIDQAASNGNLRAVYCVNPGASISYTNGHATRDMAYIFRSYRLVDTASVLSGTATETSSENPPSMTTSHNNAMVVACVYVSDTNNTSVTAPSGYGELSVINSNDPDGDSQSCIIGIANKIVPTAGAENPGAFTVTTTTKEYSFTIGLKPA